MYKLISCLNFLQGFPEFIYKNTKEILIDKISFIYHLRAIYR